MSNLPAYPKNPLLEEIHSAAQRPASDDPNAGINEVPVPSEPPARELAEAPPETLPEKVGLASLVDRTPVAAVAMAGCIGLLAGLGVSYALSGSGRHHRGGYF